MLLFCNEKLSLCVWNNGTLLMQDMKDECSGYTRINEPGNIVLTESTKMKRGNQLHNRTGKANINTIIYFRCLNIGRLGKLV